MINFLKISVNLVAAFFICYFAYILFGLIVVDVECDRILKVSLDALTYTFPFALAILALITCANYLIERKLEKIVTGKSYLKITYVHLALYFIVFFWNMIYLVIVCQK